MVLLLAQVGRHTYAGSQNLGRGATPLLHFLALTPVFVQPKRETLCECIKKPTEMLATQATLTGSFCSLFIRHHFARKPLASSYLFVVLFIYLFFFLD